MKNLIVKKILLVTLAAMTFLSSECMAAHNYQEFNPQYHEKINGKYAIKNQLLVAVKANVEAKNFLNQFSKDLNHQGLKVARSEIISSDQAHYKIIKIQFSGNQSLPAILDKIQQESNIEWSQPNYIYNIGFDPQENTPNDPKIKDQYHHQLMMNTKAWDIAKGESILIGVTDDGFDLKHEDLLSRFAPGQGYNFCDNNADVSNKNGNGDHGTHVSGIAAAELNNGKGGAGVAGEAVILPIKFYSRSCQWTSELVYRSYQYAADNGVRIISTSYNIDKFVGDKTFKAALEYVYDHGVLHFNSAGNNHQQNPPRQIFKELILVASTDANDRKSSFSNYGKEIQISAPGENILSTMPRNQYGAMSGTSMATPNAAGAAALIWSLHGYWTRDQVAAQLIGTADNIDELNPIYKGLLGTGRINTFRALTEHVAPPKVRDMDVKATQCFPFSINVKCVALSVRMDKLLSPEIVNHGEHWEVKSLASASIIPVKLKTEWSTGSMILELSTILTPGKYQLTIKDSLKDPFGQSLDGKSTGTPGGDYTQVFEVV